MLIWLFVILGSAAMLGIGFAIVAICLRYLWHPLAVRHAAREPSSAAVTRRFQSFRLGAMNLGFSVHVTVDEDHLHLYPARLLRWLGARSMSIPWEAIHPHWRNRRGTWMIVRIDGRSLLGPAWCLRLADASHSVEQAP